MANNWVQGGPTTFIPAPNIRTVDNYQELPFFGQPNEIYFCKDMNKLVVWDENAKDWHIVTTMYGEDPYPYHPEDEHNDRRGAIMAQRKRRG